MGLTLIREQRHAAKHRIPLDHPAVEVFHMKVFLFSPPLCPALLFLFSLLLFKPERLDTDVLNLVQSLKFAFYDAAKCDSGMHLEVLATGDSNR